MTVLTMPTVGVVFITHNAVHQLPKCLPPVFLSHRADKVLVVNSSSGDGTAELARSMGAEVLIVPRNEFNHGATREIARTHIGTDIVVMMTPDAHAISADFLTKLVTPIERGEAAVSYARQIPHYGADFFERFPRDFNYPADGQLRSLQDVKKYGSFLFFCSNSCAAWNNRALDQVGGFPTVLTNEDTFAAAKLLVSGAKIAYVADAVVRHSHRYSLVQEFRRYVDTGYARAQYGREAFLHQRDEGHGRKFIKAMFSELAATQPVLVPYGLLQCAVKYLGYRIGRLAARYAVGIMPILSSQDFYWASCHHQGEGRRGVSREEIVQ